MSMNWKQRLDQTLFMRGELEKGILLQLCAKVPEGRLALLRQTAEEGGGEDFHRQLFAAGEKELCYWMALELLTPALRSALGEAEKAGQEDCVAIVEALERGDSLLALQLVQRHTDRCRTLVWAALSVP